MTEPDYADLLNRLQERRSSPDQAFIGELGNALRCALALKGSLETVNGFLVEREKALLADVNEAHTALDVAGVPRDNHGTEELLTLKERIETLQFYRESEAAE